MGTVYFSSLHLNIWLKPVINWVLKKCNPVKSWTRVLSLGLYTKSPISNQTKAIVPKAVIWSSVWSEFASWCELRLTINLIFIQREKSATKEKSDNPNSWRGQQKVDIEKPSDNYSSPAKKVWRLFLLIPPYFKIALWVRMVSRNVQKLWKMSRALMKEEKWQIPVSLNKTPKAKWRDPCHFTLPTHLRGQGREGNFTLAFGASLAMKTEEKHRPASLHALGGRPWAEVAHKLVLFLWQPSWSTWPAVAIHILWGPHPWAQPPPGIVSLQDTVSTIPRVHS
jgi:hypothetical protein